MGLFMKDLSYRTLDDQDFAFIELLRSIGMQRNVATLIAFLRNVPEATSRDIEMTTDLRQPEVSIAIRDLRTKGWVEEYEIKNKGKGRPMKVYHLAVSIGDIIKHIEGEKKAEEDAKRCALQRLNEIAAEKIKATVL